MRCSPAHSCVKLNRGLATFSEQTVDTFRGGLGCRRTRSILEERPLTRLLRPRFEARRSASGHNKNLDPLVLAAPLDHQIGDCHDDNGYGDHSHPVLFHSEELSTD